MAQPTAGPSGGRRASARLLWTGFAVLLLDQVVKKLVVSLMRLGDSVDLLGPVVRLTRTENTGAAFGLFRGRSVVFIVVSSLAAVAIVVFRREIAKLVRVEQFAFALVLGGALGNLADRLRHGAVIDFIDIGIRDLRWPAFNVADSAIVIGVTLLAVRFLFFARPGAPDPLPAAPDREPE
jgi:signal peptidase II